MAPQASIICYYDVVSPYSYFAVTLLNRYRSQWKTVDIVLRPVFLPGILSGAKNQPPATVAAKLPYMVADLQRISTCAGIPYTFPSVFPVMSIPAMRLLVAIQKHESEDRYVQCVAKEAYWFNNQNISQKEVLIAAVTPVLGSEAKAEQYYEMTSDKDVKQELIDNTNQAIEAGAFGAPTFIVTTAGSDEPHMFFGSDRFETMASILNVPYPGLAPKNASKL
ncbi:Glutathione S-transferase kappa 1 [Mortierella alpina]|uniref:Glutathione S-transferase kappa n=1 Tax=Mortierella alpina TaxID=64518 RepID=A0A9P6J9V8_MORAP|nr:Glutathione S-transferase kappa 1 [Mortierella alpina]